tara:strand:+ start:332 stop:544 length:213 start_codon:yes stop_codon:yes gene_type:complete
MGAYKSPGKVGAKSGAGDFSEAEDTSEGFKKGGKAKVMSEASEGRKGRKSGGAVLSSASAGTPRGKQSHY